jgi:hypothetical protein
MYFTPTPTFEDGGDDILLPERVVKIEQLFFITYIVRTLLAFAADFI